MKVFSIFPSIDGEINALYQGRATTFIRLAGCNLRCYKNSGGCDTPQALNINSGNDMTINKIIDKVMYYGLKKVTVTGGEPLLQKEDLKILVKYLKVNYGIKITIETNGSLNIGSSYLDHTKFKNYVDSFIIDYKTPSSGCSEEMWIDNYTQLGSKDVIKFIIADDNDYEFAKKKITGIKLYYDKFNPNNLPVFALSTKYNCFDNKKLIEYILKDKLDVVLNIQIHKHLGLIEDQVLNH